MTDVETTVSYDKLEKVSVDESEHINTDLPEPDGISPNDSESNHETVLSEEKNHENVTPVDQKTQKNRLTLIDSDSDDEVSEKSNPKSSDLINAVTNQSNVDNESDNETVDRINKKRLTLIDSDSENDENNDSASKVDENIETNEVGTKDDDHSEETIYKRSKKRLTLLDSESEGEDNHSIPKLNDNNEDDESEKENADSNVNQTQKKKSRLRQICDSESEDEMKIITPLENDNSATTFTFQTDVDVEQELTNRRLKTLCDSESSAEETEDTFEHISKENIIKQKRTKKKAEPTEKKMTGKEALEQRRQIKSESQKMAREIRVHLPYHRPKQHSLQDFLKRRSLINTIKAPPNTPTSLSIKMGSKHLKTAEQKLKKREKEIEEFYKSESEAEEEPEPQPVKVDETKNETIQIKESEKVPLEENSDKNIEIEAEKTEEMDLDKKDQQDKSSEELLQNNIFEEKQEVIKEIASEEILQEKSSEELLQKNIEEKQEVTKEISPEEILQKKSSEEFLQKNISEEKQVNKEITPEEKLPEKSSEEIPQEKLGEETQQDKLFVEQETVEQMEVDSEEQSSNNEITEGNKCEATVDNTEPEQNEDEFSDLNESNEEDKEAKLRELREILEKNLMNTEPESPSKEHNEEEQMESEPTEPENTEIEATQTVEDKEAIQKKLAEMEEKLKQLNPVIALKGNLHPRLSGGPNELIVLDDDIEKSKRVTNLMERFLKHTAKKVVHKKAEVSILNVEAGVINKETITLTEEDPDDEPAKKIQIPGVKMKKLRIELEDQIIKKRLDEWKKRQEEMKLDNEEYDGTYAGEKEDCGVLGNKILDNEEEEELTESSSSESEEEEEEDIEIKEKPRVKSAFVNEEAEESDDYDEAVEDNEDNDEDEEEDEDENDEPELAEEESNSATTKKTLRRIIKPSEDLEDEEECDEQKKINNESQNLHKNGPWDDNDDDIPAYQQPSDRLDKTPCKFITQSKNDLSTFLSPTLHLTALQGMHSATKSLQDSPNVNSFLPPEPSPLKSNPFIKTKLFTDQESVDNLDELEEVCSGKFKTQIGNKNDKSIDNFSTQENELFNICSGDFSGLTQNESSTTVESSLPVKSTQSLDLLNNEESQNFKLTIENEATTVSFNNETNSQLEDENTNTSKFPKMIIASSSEDEDKENESPKKKKLKKKKRKYIIDDISITDDDEEDKLQDLDLEDEETSTRNVDYDSEENEIEYELDEEMDESEKPVHKASDFFEAEAELSESEWGSADEDEKNLDDYEVEEGDGEKINEKKVQRELERMHMRNILDDDQREVQMLQELLLEDGELHGAGRERKFRWKNADSLSWNTTDTDKPKEDEEECEELESELQWRKMRHEREMFLKEQQTQKNVGEEEILNDSQILKLGQKALKKFSIGSQNSSQKKTPVAEALSKTDDIKLPFALAIKRGSFLQRSETTLARLAEITRVTGSLSGPKNSKNFVFTSVEKTDIIEEEQNTKKRKADEGTPKVLKKLRIADMSPNVQKRKKKLILT